VSDFHEAIRSDKNFDFVDLTVHLLLTISRPMHLEQELARFSMFGCFLLIFFFWSSELSRSCLLAFCPEILDSDWLLLLRINHMWVRLCPYEQMLNLFGPWSTGR